MRDYTAWLDAWKTYHSVLDKMPFMLFAGLGVGVFLILAVVMRRDVMLTRTALIMALVSSIIFFALFLKLPSSKGAPVPSKPVSFARQLETQTGVKDLQCLTSDGATANLDTEGFPDKDSYACRYVSKDGTLHDGLKLVIDRNGNKAGLFDGDGKAILAGKGDTA